MQATTADAGSSTTMASSGNTATTTDANTSNGSDNGKRGHTRAAGSTTVEKPLATMQAYFRRFRALRGKSVEGVAHDSLQRSWCAMIVRWNRMLRANASFVEWHEAREEVVGNYSLRDLRARVCSNAWDVGRICCVQVREGCAVCGS
ncbi:hypothetical protein PR003_g7188 [Phytophthora rubi]|uniref:Uncharacterized protein n=2 Tax=Phytophthora rubi TaxID=129364 RepID=A0A6A4FKK6_9STRA|nr:hypothetical protein PR003_g7188 [Phytophthora rubi]